MTLDLLPGGRPRSRAARRRSRAAGRRLRLLPPRRSGRCRRLGPRVTVAAWHEAARLVAANRAGALSVADACDRLGRVFLTPRGPHLRAWKHWARRLT